MSGACVSYYGPFTGPFRDNLVKQWKDKCEELEIPHSEKFALEEVMGNPVEIQDWNMLGLPSDSVSVSNGIMVKRGLRRPLMIDPQLQATKWIKNMGE